MVEADPPAVPPEAAAAARMFVRAVHGEDDALIEALVRSAAEACETYTRRLLVARTVRETLTAGAEWRRLSRNPVRAITSVERRLADGGTLPLGPDAYAIDIDANGDGWVRLATAASLRATITYQAGLAADWGALPEALSHGVVRLAGHFYALRGGDPAREPRQELPASVTALWRPYRRLSLA